MKKNGEKKRERDGKREKERKDNFLKSLFFSLLELSILRTHQLFVNFNFKDKNINENL